MFQKINENAEIFLKDLALYVISGCFLVVCTLYIRSDTTIPNT